jgi:hypothetical protein
VNRHQNKRPLQLRLLAQRDIAAASGIAVCNGELCVLADDERGLVRYSALALLMAATYYLPGT